MNNRIHNFSAGPSTLPTSVVQEMQENLLSYQGSGMSVMEMSHRGDLFMEIIEEARTRIRRLYGLSDAYDVLFVHGGASLQFAMVPMNFIGEGESADYIETGTWSTKAITEVRIQNKGVRVVASSGDREFTYIPEAFDFSPEARFVHITTNNTIRGTQWHALPETDGVPLIADMSSDILSRPVDMDRFGMIYGGAQKNMGPSGTAVVILRKDFVERIPQALPTMLSYRTYVEKESMFNTPATFPIYAISLVTKWLEETMGGLAAMEAVNRRKASKLYGVIDEDDFYEGTAEKNDRSLMNATFRLRQRELEPVFVKQSLEAGFAGLKGHKSVGGLRASIYNAVSEASVDVLCDFMDAFRRKHR
ncbi:3-phosphoserine/phosphohydroxythreonine transaminase [Desulfoluna sp.]|uniref:3-phosphoserine/phosphohydroxythreonine transaminase n=1 Tax=Desulfoluna sp. TaxID=2045199 RepID=UPI002632B17A|nr:3-phosphoserine/phosphohydroxythreonine transaminase [Desulfoluna sp.]